MEPGHCGSQRLSSLRSQVPDGEGD